MASMQTPEPRPRPGMLALRLATLLALLALVIALVAACSPALVAVAMGDRSYAPASGVAVQGAAAVTQPDNPVDAPVEAEVLPATEADVLATATAIPPTETPLPSPTPTDTPTNTPTHTPSPTLVPPTATPLPTETPLPTATPLPPTPPAMPQLAQAPAASSPTRIQAPSIGLDVPVVDMGYTIIYVEGRQATGWQVPNEAAGFQQGSALPGHPGNTVIVGHSNTAGRVFLPLPGLAIGDRVLVYVESQAYAYEVTQKIIVQEVGVSIEQRIENARWIAPTTDERLTLVTCWPPTGAAERLIVVARPVS